MLLAFLDETYTREAFVIACVVIEAAQVPELSASLNRIVDAVVPFDGSGPPPELHAYELVSARGPWRPVESNLRRRAKIYCESLQCIARHADAIFVHRSVPGLVRGERSAADLHGLGLSAMLSVVDRHVRGAGELALVVADEVPYGADLVEVFASAGHGGLIDTLHFASSRTSRLVQAADVVAYLARRTSTGTTQGGRGARVDAWLWEAIGSKVILLEGSDGAS